MNLNPFEEVGAHYDALLARTAGEMVHNAHARELRVFGFRNADPGSRIPKMNMLVMEAFQ